MSRAAASRSETFGKAMRQFENKPVSAMDANLTVTGNHRALPRAHISRLSATEFELSFFSLQMRASPSTHKVSELSAHLRVLESRRNDQETRKRRRQDRSSLGNIPSDEQHVRNARSMTFSTR